DVFAIFIAVPLSEYGKVVATSWKVDGHVQAANGLFHAGHCLVAHLGIRCANDESLSPYHADDALCHRLWYMGVWYLGRRGSFKTGAYQCKNSGFIDNYLRLLSSCGGCARRTDGRWRKVAYCKERGVTSCWRTVEAIFPIFSR